MKYKNYVNSLTGDNRIFSNKEIADMSVREVFKNKDAIMSQHSQIGIPSEKELQANNNVVYVQAYTRADGTEVKAHYRSKPDGVESNNLSAQKNSGTPTGGASGIEVNNNGIFIDEESIAKIPDPTDESKGIAGVMKGSEMTIEQAGGVNVNPNYNSDDERYKKNCQACIGVFEARIRGYDIEALPYEYETHHFIEYKPEYMFINPETKLVEHFKTIDVNNNRDFENWIEENVKGGERYMLKFLPQGSSTSHIVSMYRDNNGNIIFNDVMTGKTYGKEFMKKFSYMAKYPRRASYHPSILRTDNKVLNIPMVSKISKPSSKYRRN